MVTLYQIRSGSMVAPPNLPSQLHPTEKVEILLLNGEAAILPLCHPVFSEWAGALPRFDYGKKPVLEYKGEACFAELVILRLLLERGWEGAWVETYGGTHYLRSMPEAWNLKSGNVTIPEIMELLLKRIWKAGNTTACFDVFAWQGNQIVFCEAKRSGKDRLTSAQLKFIQGALACGVSQDVMLIVEWSVSK